MATRKRTHWFPLPYEKKKRLAGFLFVSIWLVGFFNFFVIPFITAFVYSFSKVQTKPGLMQLDPVGLQNYLTVLLNTPDFIIRLTATLQDMVWQIPCTIFMSLFLSMVLNSKFRGRMFMRSVFFLPVIISSGVVMNIIVNANVDYGGSMMSTTSALFQGVSFERVLLDMRFPLEVVSQIMMVINGVFRLIWRGGVQILLFLAGLQAIPHTLYEAADVEGATKWESFWKITFPILSPTTILVTYYTIVDYGSDGSNFVVLSIREAARKARLDISATMSVIWFLIIIAIAGLVLFLTRKRVYFMDDRG